MPCTPWGRYLSLDGNSDRGHENSCRGDRDLEAAPRETLKGARFFLLRACRVLTEVNRLRNRLLLALTFSAVGVGFILVDDPVSSEFSGSREAAIGGHLSHRALRSAVFPGVLSQRYALMGHPCSSSNSLVISRNLFSSLSRS